MIRRRYDTIIQEEAFTDSEEETLIKEKIIEYHNFLMKYVNAFDKNMIDFRNYDFRLFLSLYEPDKIKRMKLRKGKYHSFETKRNAYDLLFKSQSVFKTYERKDIEHEVLLVFLDCYKSYNPKGASFAKYLMKVFKYKMKRRIDEIRVMSVEPDEDAVKTAIEEIPDEDASFFDENQDQDLELHHKTWLHGLSCREEFKVLKYHERFILQKYYMENLTDKEISHQIPYHPKSIHRMRLRSVKKIEKEFYTA